MSPVEIKWEAGAGRLRIRDLEMKPSRWFGFNEENQPRFLSIRNPWDGLELPFGKFVIARHFPTYDNPFGLRLLSRCFWPAVFKKGGIKFWVTLAEKYGMPFLVGKYRPGAPLSEQQEMLSKLVGMVRDACAVIPQGGTVEILESGKGGASAEIHSGLKAAMDAEMSKVIMGQTLTAEVSDKGGSRAQGQVHEEILEDFRQGDQTLVRIAMEEIAWVCGQVNAPGVPTPKFVWFEEEEPKKEHADRDKTLKETGVRFRKSYYLRTYGLQEDDFDLEGTQDKPEGKGGKKAKAQSDEEEEFAEGSGFPDQDALDAAIEALSPEELQRQTEGMLAPLIEMIRAGESFEAILEALAGDYPQMDAAALEEMLARAIFVAEVWGRLSASAEAAGD
jgi:phage gp29-like protein